VFNDATIMGVIEKPDMAGPEAQITIRDYAGRYSWDCRLFYESSVVQDALPEIPVPPLNLSGILGSTDSIPLAEEPQPKPVVEVQKWEDAKPLGVEASLLLGPDFGLDAAIVPLQRLVVLAFSIASPPVSVPLILN
jgi:hypothetical protein